jgi:ribosomal protein L7/L12
MNDIAAVCSIASLLFVIAVVFRLALLERRVAAISRIDGKLDALLRHAGVQFDPYENVSADVADALRRGEKIEAIKRYRLATGAGLKDAKDFVEEVQRRSGSGV